MRPPEEPWRGIRVGSCQLGIRALGFSIPWGCTLLCDSSNVLYTFLTLSLGLILFFDSWKQFFFRMAPRGRRRSQQASVESSGAPTYEENLVERLARSLERSGFTSSTVDQARRLGAVGFDGATNPMVALSWLDDTEKSLDEGMQCPDEDRVKIAGFLLEGNARKWWAYERTRKRHTWTKFKAAFHTEFCPPSFVETKRLEFETLTQGSMTVSEYERRFKELSDFCPNLVTDEVSKKRRFLNGLVETIDLSLSGSDHPTYQLMRDAALEVERQTLIHQTKRRSYDGLSSGNPSQGSFKRGSFSSGSSGSRGSSGERRGASSRGFREVDTHRVLDFDQRVVVVAIFRGLQAEAVSVRLVMFVARFMMGHASGIIHAISVGRQDISGGTAPIEDPARLEFQDQVLSSNGLVGMKDRIRRQGRPRVVPLAWDSSLHQWLKAEDREDDHLLEAESML